MAKKKQNLETGKIKVSKPSLSTKQSVKDRTIFITDNIEQADYIINKDGTIKNNKLSNDTNIYIVLDSSEPVNWTQKITLKQLITTLKGQGAIGLKHDVKAWDVRHMFNKYSIR